jgi:hypothetical protein
LGEDVTSCVHRNPLYSKFAPKRLETASFLSCSPHACCEIPMSRGIEIAARF